MQLIARLQAALSEAEASSGSSPAASASPNIPLTSFVPGEAYCAEKNGENCLLNCTHAGSLHEPTHFGKHAAGLLATPLAEVSPSSCCVPVQFLFVHALVL